MSTQENKQLVIEGYKLFQAGDIQTLLTRYHDDAEWVGPESDVIPFFGTFHGKSEIAQFFAQIDAATQIVRFELKQLIAEDDKVVVTGQGTWLAKPTGRKYDSAWAHVFTFRDGKVARFESFSDTAATERAFHPVQTSDTSASAQARH